MNHNESDNPARLPDETLLAFLDKDPAGPSPAHASNRADTRHQNSQKFSPVVPEIGSDAGAEGTLDESSENCLTPATAMRLILGNAEDEESEALLTHVALCPACGDLLTRSLGAVQGNPSAEEAAAIEELAATRTDWQRKLARELAETKTRRRPVLMRPGSWIGAGAIAAGLIAAVGLFLWQRQANTPEHQLAKAYEQSRSLELRIPEANFASLATGSHTRGTATGDEAAPLLEARARLARELERSPHDARLEQLQARADILEERYDSATDVLDRLVAQGPVTAELLTDAASAYYQRGLVTGSELDRSTALDYLRRADELAPTDPVILFNEAIVMEDRGQMMNAVEVWNRYITVERDPKWAAEGKRKLTALEQTLNKLKSHQSRINQMLSTPESMDALAKDKQKLASLDEELSSYELDKLFLSAYPPPNNGPQSSELIHSQQARGSPCPESCLATRRLLKAIASSLEIQHHDFWLTDLLSPDIDSLSPAIAASYVNALQLLGQSTRENTAGVPARGAKLASDSRQLFHQLASAVRPGSSLATGSRAGEERAAAEYMFALQRQVYFQDCRASAQHLQSGRRANTLNRYPWIETVEEITEKVCDDTPETRMAGAKLERAAMQLAESNHYPLLQSRIQMRLVDDAQNSGDMETAERLALATLRQLTATDPPILRITGTIPALAYIEEESTRAHMAELCVREQLGWFELSGDHMLVVATRLDLARADLRIGAMKEAENQLQLAYKEEEAWGLRKVVAESFVEPEIMLSSSLLERGDLEEAEHHLNKAASRLGHYSDSWGVRTYAATRGQLQIARGRVDEAAQTLEAEIRSSEGRNVSGSDRATAAEYAQLDHDLYAELAAVWLTQGRPSENVLALWERFRMRSRGLQISQSNTGALDCEQPRLAKALRMLGNNLLIGQVLLLDRVLIYRVDRSGIKWSQRSLRRQDVLDSAQTLERAVSSPSTSPQTAEKLGNKLGEALVPTLPDNLNSDATLILEPDPLLQNLSWPVLPTPSGPLGLRYPLAESRSILIEAKNPNTAPDTVFDRQGLANGARALVVGASVASEGEPPLPEAITEAKSVNRILHSSELLLGKQATTASIAEELGSAPVFHFAGHAKQSVNGTELLLASASSNDKTPWIDGAFLRQHPPRLCRLAVLSACATGRRETAWKHPLQDIVDTLGSLGVPEVVATRWQIDSEASVPFMEAFYQQLAQGDSVPLALTSARRVLSSRSMYRNPYYWGAYYDSGEEIKYTTGELHARR